MDALNKLFQNAKETLPKQVEDNNDQIKTLETERDDLMKEKAGNVSDIVAQQMDLPPATTGDDATAPTPNPPPTAGATAGAAEQDLLHVYFRGGKLVVQARRIYAEEPVDLHVCFRKRRGIFVQWRRRLLQVICRCTTTDGQLEREDLV